MNEMNGYHVGIILDGNGRWAKAQGQPRLFGHAAGERNVNRIVKSCPDLGVHTLKVYAFAVANWKRDREEVEGIWNIFREFFKVELDDLHEFGARVRMIGDRAMLPKDIRTMIEEAEETTKDNTKVTVLIALCYDGVDEVARASKEIARKAAAGELAPEDVTIDTLAAHLDTAGIPDPDIIIRTGMEQPDTGNGMALWRSSSFLQLQSAQAVCVSTPVLWPDFTPEDLRDAIQFAKPDERLFGGQRG